MSDRPPKQIDSNLEESGDSIFLRQFNDSVRNSFKKHSGFDFDFVLDASCFDCLCRWVRSVQVSNNALRLHIGIDRAAVPPYVQLVLNLNTSMQECPLYIRESLIQYAAFLISSNMDLRTKDCGGSSNYRMSSRKQQVKGKGQVTVVPEDNIFETSAAKEDRLSTPLKKCVPGGDIGNYAAAIQEEMNQDIIKRNDTDLENSFELPYTVSRYYRHQSSSKDNKYYDLKAHHSLAGLAVVKKQLFL